MSHNALVERNYGYRQRYKRLWECGGSAHQTCICHWETQVLKYSSVIVDVFTDRVNVDHTAHVP